jgi:thioredoxin-related protein
VISPTVIPTILGKEKNMLRFHFNYVNKSVGQLLCLVAMVASVTANAGEPRGKNWHQSWKSAWQASQAEGRPILMFVTMDGCYYCEKMRRETYANSQVLDDLRRNFVLVSIDSTRNPKTVSKLNLHRFPTTLIVSRDAKVIDSMSGYAGPEQLRSWLKASGSKLARR